MMQRSLLPTTAPRADPPSSSRWFRPNPPLRDWAGKRVWIVGASSGIGLALAHQLHGAGAQVIVSARHADALAAFVRDHAGAQSLVLDVGDAEGVRSAGRAALQGGAIDAVAYCAAHYRAVRADEWSLDEMLRHQQVNYVGALHVIDAMLPGMLALGRGHLALVGSVAGYRGLPRSLAYGPTKAALILLAETLYLDLRSRGIGVSIINPGFVRTPLTAQNDFHMPALMTPEEAARAILRGWAKGRFEIHFPRRFTFGMKLLKLLPFALYQAAVRRFTGG